MKPPMETVTLISMPFVDVSAPSIGLTQLKSVTKRALGDRVAIKILYLSHDFAHYMAEGGKVVSNGSEMSLYDYFCGNQLHNTGLGDWFFRQVAFPNLPDNSKEYFARYFPGHSRDVTRFKEAVLERRRGLAGFLDALIERHRVHESTIVGFTSMFQQNAATFAMARHLKAARPDITIAVGGANCEAPMGEEMVRNVESVDYVFSGPALRSFPRFVERHLEGDADGKAAIAGVLSKGAQTNGGTAPMGEELDINVDVELDYSEFIESVDRSFSGQGVQPVILFETSRGCWWGEKAHCTFCGLNGITMQYRAMQPDSAVRLIQGLIDRYSAQSNYFFCVDNIMPTNYVKDVLPRIKTPPGTTLFYEVKANLTDEEVRTLAASGVTKIQPGIESMATSTLKLMKKGSSVFVNLRLLKACLKNRVRPQWNLLVGFPGEGEDVYSMYVRDLARLFHLYPPDGAFPVRFDRYSPYYTKAKEYGLNLHYLEYYRYTYPFDDAALSRMAYFFTDTNFGAPYIQMMLKWLERIRERTHTWLERWKSSPKLYLERNGDGGVVRDSRSGEMVEHPVTPRQVELLEHLETARSDDSLPKDLGPGVEDDLAYLDERCLVWREEERVMSLVLPGEY